MATDPRMQNISMFKTQSPYEQQIEEMKRRQQMAEMLQQQALQPLESQVAPGGMVVPTSPVLGLTKMLQAYMGGKQLRDIEKQRGEVEKGARSEALDYLRSFNPEQKTIGMGEAAVSQLPMPQVGNNGQVSYQAPSVTAMPNARPVASLDQPMQMQVGGPLNRQDQMRRSEEGILSDNPLVRALAQTKYEAANKTVNPMDYLNKFDPDKLTPESLQSLQADIAAGRTPDVGGLTFKGKLPETLSPFQAQSLALDRERLAAANKLTPYQAEALALRREELKTRTKGGKVPLSATAQRELLQTDENVEAMSTGVSLLEKALELSPKAYEGFGAAQRAYAATQLPDAVMPAGAPETIEFDNLMLQQILPQMKGIFGSNPTEGEREILLKMQGSAGLSKTVRENLIRNGIELAKRRQQFEKQKAQKLRSGEYFSEPTVPTGFDLEVP